MNLSTRLAVASLALAGLLSACTTMSTAADAPSLDGTAWVLSSLPGRTLVPGTTATLRFEGGRAAAPTAVIATAHRTTRRAASSRCSRRAPRP